MKNRIASVVALGLLAVMALLTSPAPTQATPTQVTQVQQVAAVTTVAAATDYKYWSCYYDGGFTAVKVSAWDNSDGTRTYHMYMREKRTAPSTNMLWIKMKSPSGYTWKTFDLRSKTTASHEWYYKKPNQNYSYVNAEWSAVRNGITIRLRCPKTAGSNGYLM